MTFYSLIPAPGRRSRHYWAAPCASIAFNGQQRTGVRPHARRRPGPRGAERRNPWAGQSNRAQARIVRAAPAASRARPREQCHRTEPAPLAERTRRDGERVCPRRRPGCDKGLARARGRGARVARRLSSQLQPEPAALHPPNLRASDAGGPRVHSPRRRRSGEPLRWQPRPGPRPLSSLARSRPSPARPPVPHSPRFAKG